jgi:hypothetical protein
MNQQGTDAWRLDRCGRCTSSEFSSVLAKGKEGRMRLKYLRRILAERLTGKPMETYHNGHMERGHEQEPLARMAYEAETGNLVEEVGFLAHQALMAGCSPDGLVGDDGGCEIKSVIPTVQIETVMRGRFPPEHAPQIYGNLWITGRKYWDFVSYSPDMPEHLQLYIFRVTPDPDYIKALEKEVRTFLNEVDRLYAQLMQRDDTILAKLVASVNPNALATQA